MVRVSLLTSLLPPSGVAAVRFSSAASDANSEKYTQRYVVTALSEDRTEESIASAEVSVVANLYATGTTVKVSWNLVTGARYFRVYKYQGGLFGYIGETVENSIVDDNIAPETGTTPPYTDDVFQVSGGISGASIVNGGSGYDNGKRVVKVLDYGWWGNGNWNTQEGYAGLMTLRGLPGAWNRASIQVPHGVPVHFITSAFKTSKEVGRGLRVNLIPSNGVGLVNRLTAGG